MQLDDRPHSQDDLRALGDFLRAKRRTIQPSRPGTRLTRRRLVPGLSRDEVAAIADIGTSWYARLEAGRVAKPTLATINGISAALQLNAVECSFIMHLAGLHPQKASGRLASSALQAISALVGDTQHVSLSLWDRYLTPLGGNAVADAMFGHSEPEDAIERHPIVRLPHERTRTFFGDEYELYARSIVGMFRRGYVGGSPSQHARDVFAHAQGIPIFTKYWDQHVVANAIGDQNETFVRNHWIVGMYTATAVDLIINDQNDDATTLTIIAPADEESRSKFSRLAALGKSSVVGLAELVRDQLGITR